MDKIGICKQLKRTVRKIVLFDSQDNPISLGTGVIVNDLGFLLTDLCLVCASPRFFETGQ